jgi:hypothetical protein
VFDGEGSSQRDARRLPAPTALDVRGSSCPHTVTPSPLNPLGIKGVGEAGAFRRALFAQALEDALGLRQGVERGDSAGPEPVVGRRGQDQFPALPCRKPVGADNQPRTKGKRGNQHGNQRLRLSPNERPEPSAVRSAQHIITMFRRRCWSRSRLPRLPVLLRAGVSTVVALSCRANIGMYIPLFYGSSFNTSRPTSASPSDEPTRSSSACPPDNVIARDAGRHHRTGILSVLVGSIGSSAGEARPLPPVVTGSVAS